MKTQVTLDVHHLARIEGHGNIVIRIKDGALEEARWDVVETPRFFEVMFRGKHFSSTAILAARICGICSISHCLTSLRATEDAFGAVVPPAALKLRQLVHHGETLQSHALHLFFLAAPDYFRLPSALPLLHSHPEVVGIAVRLKGIGNRISDLVAGRTTHPVTLQPGGVTRMPERTALLELRDQLDRSLEDLANAERLVKGFRIPDFERPTEYVSLKGEHEYPFIGGPLISSDGVERDERDYLEMTNEYVTADNTSKWTRLSRDSYAVGALARCNNNFELLHPEARTVAAELGLEPVCHNPFMCNVAQLVECVHCTHDAMRLIDELTSAPAGDTMSRVAPRAGVGTGAVEAPRGILFHHYRFDAEGRVEHADCVVPTTQNNANIHLDLPELIRQSLHRGASDKDIERLCSMLVRAYDPCLSCSVH